MFRFATVSLIDEQECYDYLVEMLHADGLYCPVCKTKERIMQDSADLS